MTNDKHYQTTQLSAYARDFPDAEVPLEKRDCFGLDKGKCSILTATWCKYEECGFYKASGYKR